MDRKLLVLQNIRGNGMKKKISTILIASMVMSNASPVLNVYASEVIKEKNNFYRKKRNKSSIYKSIQFK